MIQNIILHRLSLDKRQIAIYFLSMVAGFTFFSTIFNSLFHICNDEGENIFVMILTIVAMVLAFLIGATKTFKPFEKKSSGIQFLMLPATVKEKFIANIIYYTFGSMLMVFLAIIASDAIQSVYNLIFHEHVRSLTREFFYAATKLCNMSLVSFDGKNPFEHQEGFFTLLVCSIIDFMSNHAIFLLGGSFFRRHAFLKTIGIQIGLGIASMILSGLLFKIVDIPHGILTIHFFLGMTFTINFIRLVFSILIYWWSYRRFCRKAIV